MKQQNRFVDGANSLKLSTLGCEFSLVEHSFEALKGSEIGIGNCGEAHPCLLMLTPANEFNESTLCRFYLKSGVVYDGGIVLPTSFY